MSETWTAEDAAALLDPPLSAEDVRALIRVAKLQPQGKRRTGRTGRPALTYDTEALIRIHTALAPYLAAAENTCRVELVTDEHSA